jgi:membrane fusion protein, multidrug efflux system
MATIAAQGIRSQAAGAQAQVAAARAQLAVAQQRLAGSKRLFDAGAISAIEYRTAQANVEAAEAQVAAARAQSAGAGEAAARATITSPISGVVSARDVNDGEPVSIGDNLFTVVNASELELAGQVGVEQAARVRVGQPVSFALDVYPNQVFKGRVARVDPTADPGTRQVGVFVRLSNPGNRILGGQYAQGRIETGSTATAITIPEAAVMNRTSAGGQVYVIASGNKLSLRTVTLGQRDESSGRIAVLTGVQSGERVVLNPTSDMKDGSVVSVSTTTGTSATR